MNLITDEQKAEWVKALRSGEFKQGRSGLCVGSSDDPHYCCLGVAGVVILKRNYEELRGGYLRERTDMEYPAEVLLPFYWQSYLAKKNDIGCSFNEIADIIEKVDFTRFSP